MAIRDLLYACVMCGREGGIKAAERDEACACGARYARVDGALIRCQRPDGSTEVRHPAEWLDALEASRPLTASTGGHERVAIRTAATDSPVRYRGIYLGRVEQFGPPEPGWLTLNSHEIRFEPEQGEPRSWRLEDLTAVQPSSTTLQLKVKNGPILSLRFLEGSSLLWEQRVKRAVQEAYTRAGRGEIREYQPRIVCA